MMIYTAIPFGYLLIYGFLFGCVLAGLILLGRAIFKRKIALGAFGLAMCLLAGGLVAIDICLNAKLDWNPKIESDAVVIGYWADKNRALLIKADQTFKYTEGLRTFQGTWNRDDFNLYLRSPSENKTMRIIRNGTLLRIMTAPPEDPDSWNGDLGLRQMGGQQSVPECLLRRK